MNKNTKRVLSAITVASLSVTSFTGNIQNVVNAKEDKQEENALSTNRVNAEVLENEAGAVIRVSTSSNVQNVKTTYSVDTAGSKVVSFGDLKAGEVREIQVNFEEDSNKLKSLPKTTAVSDRVDFNKEVRGHKIKGSVSFEYDNGDTAPVVTPTMPTIPTKPVVTPTVPTEPTKPVAPVVTPAEPTKPVEPAKPIQPVIPDTPAEPVVTPTEPTKPAEPAKPVTPAATPVDTGLEAGMPANVKWSRAQLKEWGFTFGKITGDYNVDGDLGVFDNEDGFDKAWKDGSNALDKKYLDGTVDGAYFKKTPHGYAWYSVTKPDGTKGYAMYLYGTDGKFNDGQKAR